MNRPLPLTEPVVARFPATATQLRFWFLDQMTPGTPALNVAVRWEIRGQVQPSSIEAAFQRVVDRHEILRTRLVEEDGQLLQEVAAAVRFRLSVVELRVAAGEDPSERIEAIAQETGAVPFDLSKPGLMRATLVRLSPERAMLMIVAHHVCFDGFSIRVLGHEIGTIAEAIEAGREPDLPDLPLQYGDYALWQQEYLACGVLEEDGAFWKAQLADAPYFEIEADFPRSGRRGTAAAMTSTVLPPAFGERLEAEAKRREVSVFAYGTAVLSACLARFTGQSDVLIGTQVASRNEVDLEPLIGVFINNLVLRLPTDPEAAFADHLGRVRTVVQEALAHQSMPFHKLVELMNPPRDPSRMPLISINFNIQRTFLQNRRYGRFELLSAPSHTPGAVYDLNFQIVGRPSGWRVTLEYATELFRPATAQALLDLLVAGFGQALDHPDAPLKALPLDLAVLERRDRQAGRLARLEAAARDMGGVADAAAVAEPEGTYLFVVPQPDHAGPLEDLPAEVTAHLAARLDPADVPWGVSLLLALPRDAEGNLRRDRLRVPKKPASAIPAAPAASAPLRSIEAQLIRIWKDVLDRDAVEPTSNFFHLGGHSLLVLRMLTRVRAEMGVEIGIGAIYDNPRLCDLAGAIRAQAAPAPEKDDWRILPLQQGGTGTPLVAVNNAWTATAIHAGFATDRPAICVRLFDGSPGQEHGRRSMEEIAADYADIILKAQPQGPFLLFGICVHGNVALEAARVLKARGHDIAAVVLKDVWEPGFVERMLADRRLRWVDRRHTLKRRVRRWWVGQMSTDAFLGGYRIIRLSGALHVARALRLIGRVRRTDLEPEEEGFIDFLVAARDRYRPAPIDVPVLHVVTDDVPRAEGFDASIGWEHVVTGRLKTVRIPEVVALGDLRIGTARLAEEIETFLAEGSVGQ
ncbi:condensation domain-containing protein [Cereibacter sphaeroides]|uniref:condensation domain-containing protein n=1 Tax=Cereibacter sphaeroides TaxID=1063 RepID=UPI001F3F4B8F|nr:condensation domain-containing protein [Cereibacter sphaeroides]MCE6958682.1 condensation domain-containing protein [Cereibacter sphaeroides]MCE6973435.1 condensation domain-containing protein [Cereibacter sphaeroides]